MKARLEAAEAAERRADLSKRIADAEILATDSAVRAATAAAQFACDQEVIRVKALASAHLC